MLAVILIMGELTFLKISKDHCQEVTIGRQAAKIMEMKCLNDWIVQKIKKTTYVGGIHLTWINFDGRRSLVQNYKDFCFR